MQNRRSCLSTLLIALAVFVVLTLALEFVFTFKTQQLVAVKMAEVLNTQETPDVRIYMHPNLINFILGKVDRLTVDARDFDLANGITVSKAVIDIRGIKFDPMRMLEERQPTAITDMKSGTAEMTFSENAINELVASRFPGARIKLEEGKFRYVSDLEFLVPGMQMQVTGTAKALPDNTIEFAPEPGQIENLPVPQEVKDYLKDAFAVQYKMDDIPAGFEIRRIEVKKGKLNIHADITGLEFLTQGAMNAEN